MANAIKDENRQKVIVGVDKDDATVVIPIKVNATTGAIIAERV